MTKTEAQQFIDLVLKQFWDTWNPNDAQVGVWVSVLTRYDYEGSENALRRWYATTEKLGRVPTLGSLRKLFVVSPKDKQDKIASRDSHKEFGLARKDAMHKITWFFINTGRIREDKKIAEDAEKARKRAEQLYGGEWVIIQPPKPVSDDGKRGRVALGQAVSNILSGPDTPGQRFLAKTFD